MSGNGGSFWKNFVFFCALFLFLVAKNIRSSQRKCKSFFRKVAIMKMIEKINAFFKTTHKAALGLLAGTVALNSAPTILTPQAEAAEPPNIIFIMADDLGWTDINCRNGVNDTEAETYDSHYYETPNLAALRKAGMRFMQAYACPSCKATRQALLTGKMRDPHKVSGGSSGPDIPLADIMIPEALDAGGVDYVSAHVGKWGMGGSIQQSLEITPEVFYPDRHGFDYNFGGSHAAGLTSTYADPEDFKIYWEPSLDSNSLTSDGWNEEYKDYSPLLLFPGLGDPDPNEPNEFFADSLTTRAIQFMESTTTEGHVNEDKPFFLYLAFKSPHGPILDDLDEAFGYDFIEKSDPSGRHDRPYNMWWDGDFNDYAALVKRMDHNIGRIMKAVDEFPDPNNTIIIFFSDNGGMNSDLEWDTKDKSATDNTPLKYGKRSYYEGGVRVPLIVRWPGHTQANTVCKEPVSVLDIMPTLLEMAYGDNYDAADHPMLSGNSLVDVLEDSTGTVEVERDEKYLILSEGSVIDKSMILGLGEINEVDCTGYKLIKVNDDPSDPCYALYDISEYGGKFGSALEFDGVDDYVEMDDPNYKGITGTDSRTCAAWIKTTCASIILSWGDSSVNGGRWVFRVESGGALRVAVGAGAITGDTIVNDGNWHHVAATWENDGTPNAEDIKLYVDGTEDSVTATPQVINTNSVANVRIGEWASGYFEGLIDDVRIYSGALDPNEILWLKSEEAHGNEPTASLVAHWELDCSPFDSSGYRRHGTLMGDPVWRTAESENLYTTDPSNGYYGESVAMKGAIEAWFDRFEVKWSSSTGSGSKDTIALAISAAIASEGSNIVIEIPPKIFYENITISVDMTLRSEDPCDRDVVAATIIDGTTSGRTVTISSGVECTIEGLTISGGYATGATDSGGGIAGNGNTNSKISKCIIRDNYAEFKGGGIYNFNGEISNCTITDNTVFDKGGGLASCHGDIINCIISSNKADKGGGLNNCLGDIVNCTIVHNSAIGATSTGGGLRNCETITNCIIWGNGDDLNGTSATNSCYSGGSGNGNIGSDPCFVNFPELVDIASNDVILTVEELNDVIDDDESTIILLGNRTGDYGQDVIIEINNGGILREVISSTYNSPNTTVTFSPHINTASVAGDVVYKWPAGTTSVIEDYHLKGTSLCIDEGNDDGITGKDIDGNVRIVDTYEATGEDANDVDMGADEFGPVNRYVPSQYSTIQAAINVSTEDDTIIVDANTYYENVDFLGKAITLRSTDPCDWSVVGATVIDPDSGFGVEFSSSETSSSVLKGFTITGATIGVHCNSASPTISNCRIVVNSSKGINCTNYSDATIRNCKIQDNGCGIVCGYYSSPEISNCVISGNDVTGSGGGIYIGASAPNITNCTIVNNTATVFGDGIAAGMSSPTITNCIIWGNGDDLYGCSATFSCIEDIDGGTGNIHTDPNFVDSGSGDYSLTSVSPCIDAAGGGVAPSTDIDGQGRYDDPYTFNTGAGDPNYVDMGAFEYQGS